ncbi:MAG: phosphotransferase family protein, partial [Solirubrobacteraceae bacterium]
MPGSDDTTTDVPRGGADGLDRDRVGRWFAATVGAEPPLWYERIAGGRSNLTYRVTDAGGGEWILRRPPLGSTLGSAHDMGREHRILTGLAGTGVPAPRPVALCSDEAVTGAVFYVMELVDGVVLREQPDVEAAFDKAGRRRIGEALVDTLADLHAVDPDAAGLGELGRREGYAERQLRRWKRQWDASKTRELDAMEEAHRMLAARVPEQRGAAIVHGDYRLDN